MGVIPDRQDFVRRLTQSGAYTEAEAVVLADALDAALPQPATRLDFMQLRADFLRQMGDLRSDFADLRSDFTDLRAEVRKDFTDLRAEVRKDSTDLRTDLTREVGRLDGRIDVLSERVERVGDRTVIRISAGAVVIATALFGALRVWPASG